MQPKHLNRHILPYVAALLSSAVICYFNLFQRDAELWYRWQSVFMAAAVGFCLTLIVTGGISQSRFPKHPVFVVPLISMLMVIFTQVSAVSAFDHDTTEALGRTSFFAAVLVAGFLSPWVIDDRATRGTNLRCLATAVLLGLISGVFISFVIDLTMSALGVAALNPIDVLRIHPAAVLALGALWIGARNIASSSSSILSRRVSRSFDLLALFTPFAYVIIFLDDTSDLFGGALWPTVFVFLSAIGGAYFPMIFSGLMSRLILTFLGALGASLAFFIGARLDGHSAEMVALVVASGFIMVIATAAIAQRTEAAMLNS